MSSPAAALATPCATTRSTASSARTASSAAGSGECGGASRRRTKLLGTNQGWTRERIAGERTRIREREQATDPREVRHPDVASSHGVPAEVIRETINNPDATGLSANGGWVFYRRGTIVFTRPGDVNSVMTAYGRGGRVPTRRVK